MSQERASRTAADAENSQAIDTLDGRVDSVENNVATVQSGLTTVQNNVSTLQSNLATAQSNIGSTQNGLATAQSNISNIQNDLTDVQDDVTDVKSGLSTTQSNLATAQGNISNIQTSLATAQSDISDIQNGLTDVQDDVTDVKSDMSAVQSNLATAQSNISNIQTSLATAQSDISNMQTSIASKADAQNVATALESKANSADVASALAGKADASRAVSLTSKGYKKATSTSDIIDANYIYAIESDIDLNGNTLSVPADCTLRFDGGRLKNGNIQGNSTRIEVLCYPAFSEVDFSGSFITPQISTRMMEDVGTNNNFIKLLKLQNSDIFNEILVDDNIVVTPTANDQKLCNIGSNVRLKINTEIAISPNQYPRYAILNITGSNVEISGGTVKGDIDSHDYETTSSTHEWGHCIAFENSSCKNVKIDGVTILNAAGDGISIKGSRISVSNIKIEHCGRNGITIGTASEVIVSNFDIRDISRTSPKSAIDVEPNSGRANRVTIENGYVTSFMAMAKCDNLRLSNIEGEMQGSSFLLIGYCDGVVAENLVCKSVADNANGTAVFTIQSHAENVTLRNCRYVEDPEAEIKQYAVRIDGISNIVVEGAVIDCARFGFAKNMTFKNCYLAAKNRIPSNSYSWNYDYNTKYINCDIVGGLFSNGSSISFEGCRISNLEGQTTMLEIDSTASRIMSNFSFIKCDFLGVDSLASMLKVKGKTIIKDCSLKMSENKTCAKILTPYTQNTIPTDIEVENFSYDQSVVGSTLNNDTINNVKLVVDKWDVTKRFIARDMTLTSDLLSAIVKTELLVVEGEIDLDGLSLTLPSSVSLDLTNGTIKNGSLTIDGNKIVNYDNLIRQDLTLSGNPAEGTRSYDYVNHKQTFFNGTEWITLS